MLDNDFFFPLNLDLTQQPPEWANVLAFLGENYEL